MLHRIAMCAFATIATIGLGSPSHADGHQAAVNQHKGQPSALKIDGPAADHRNCVTGGEWGRIANPARSKKDLVTLLDGPGLKQTGNLRGVWYPICGMSPKKGRVIITYNEGTHLDLAFWMVFQGAGSGFREVASVG